MKTSQVYASKTFIAMRLAQLELRAVTLTAVAKTKPADSREAYRVVNGKQSSSGQTPTFHKWFFQSKKRRMHGALLCLLYVKYRRSYEGNQPNPHGMAFLMAFQTYKQILGNAVRDEENEITGERFNLILSGFQDVWEQIPKGVTTNFKDDNAKIELCRKCRVPHLVEHHFLTHHYVCPTC